MKRVVPISLIVLIAAAVLIISAVLKNETQPTTQVPETTQEQADDTTNAELPEPQFDSKKLQGALDGWVNSIQGDAGVVIASSDGKMLASYQPDKEFFAASIYKLFVAYEGYLQLDNNEINPNELYNNGRTRLECLDVMIRESDSPCAEKWWAELGREELTAVLKTYGLQHTDMTALTTTAKDASIMLARIISGNELSEESKNMLMRSMREQIYDATFNQVFTEEVVYNKIGFRDYDEYHDVAIIEFADGRQLIVAALTDNVGTQSIRSLGEAIRQVAAE